MNTFEMKSAIKANKGLLNLKVAQINTASDEQIKHWYASLEENTEFVASAVVTPVQTNNAVIDGEFAAENGARLIQLPYAGRSNSGQFKFTLNDSFVTTNANALRVMSAQGKLNIGDTFTFKADTIVFDAKYKCFTGQVNITNDERISTEMNSARDNKLAMQDKIALMKSKGFSQRDIDNAISDTVKDELKSFFKM